MTTNQTVANRHITGVAISSKSKATDLYSDVSIGQDCVAYQRRGIIAHADTVGLVPRDQTAHDRGSAGGHDSAAPTLNLRLEETPFSHIPGQYAVDNRCISIRSNTSADRYRYTMDQLHHRCSTADIPPKSRYPATSPHLLSRIIRVAPLRAQPGRLRH